MEFALWLGLLTVPTLSAVDGGFYAFQSMQVREAAQAAAETALTLCASGSLPAASNCTNLSTELPIAAHSTSLGSNVTLITSSTGTPPTTEGYYCTNTAGGLTAVSVSGNPWSISATSPPSAPSNCNATVAGNTQAPGDYIRVSVTFTYHPLFPGVSVASLLGTTITQSAWMRLG